MELANMWVMDIAGPAILLIILIWLVIRANSSRRSSDDQRTDQASRDVYHDEEQRHRHGTDKL